MFGGGVGCRVRRCCAVGTWRHCGGGVQCGALLAAVLHMIERTVCLFDQPCGFRGRALEQRHADAARADQLVPLRNERPRERCGDTSCEIVYGLRGGKFSRGNGKGFVAHAPNDRGIAIGIGRAQRLEARRTFNNDRTCRKGPQRVGRLGKMIQSNQQQCADRGRGTGPRGMWHRCQQVDESFSVRQLGDGIQTRWRDRCCATHK